jgi:Tol biopolymer transport system component
VFARNRSIYTMAADGSDLQQLTSGFLDEVPAWSPDGTRIAFERRQIGSAEPGPGESFIDVMDADGSHVVDTGVVAAESAKLSWSPDSARIAYTQLYVNGSDVREGIGVMNADGSGVATLAGSPSAGKLQGGSPAWSPAGATIAFGCFGSGIPGGLCLVSSSGGSPEQLLRQTCASPSWSPDNLSIACIGDDQAIHVFNLNSGNVQSVGAGGSAAAAQPDWGQ